MTDQGKNNTRIVLAALAIVTTVIMYVLVPLVRNNASGTEILQRLTSVEVSTKMLESIPEKVATQTEAISGLKVSVDRLEKKIDSHVDKGK